MAKKKKIEDTTNMDVIEQEDIVDIMKEISMQPDVEIEEIDTKEESVEEVEPVEEVNNFILDVNLSDNTIENLKEYELEDGSIDMTNASDEEIIKLTHDMLENNKVGQLSEMFEEIKNKDCNCKQKPRMTYNQMMGYDWNGTNFDM